MSLCSGIEAASVAFGPLGWKAVSFAEIDLFASAVLAHRYPHVPNLGDITRFREWPEELFAATDIVVGGPPCQAFSVAGARAGLNDERGNLTLTYAELIDHADDVRASRGLPPVLALYENVPGILSDKTNAFGCLLAALAGEDEPIVVKKWPRAGVVDGGRRRVAWATLDAQYFGVAQRRRRVFVLAVPCELVERFGVGADPAEILSIGRCLRGDTPTRREPREVAPTIPSRSSADGGLGTDFDIDGGVICMAHGQGGAEIGFDRGTTLTCNHEAPIVVHGTQDPCVSTNTAFALGRNSGGENVLVFDTTQITSAANRSNPQPGDPCHPLAAGEHPPAIAQVVGAMSASGATERKHGFGWGQQDYENGYVQPHGDKVRRLTPRECERLQGFPEIVKTCTITVFKHSNSNVCPSDQQSTNVLAALQSHKSPSNASPAEENVFPSNANAAELILNAGQENSNAPVLVNAQIDLERQHLHLHSQGKLLLSASIAGASEWCRLPIQAEDFVQLSVALLACLEKTAPTGRAALHLNTSGSFPLLIRNWFASQSGREIEELASDAEKFMSAVKKCTTFITSEAGRNFQNYDSNLQTLLCCVSTVISSFIQSGILSASSYALSIEVSHGYTLIPWRKKPSSECPDGPRYRALGNSWAIPVVRWIGQRIDSVLSRGQTRPSHVEAAQKRSTPESGEQRRDRTGS